MGNVIHPNNIEPDSLYLQISQILQEARTKVAVTVNTAMVQAYWHIGKLIVDAQGGEERAAYGDDLINAVSKKLTAQFGKGFSARNLRNMRQFCISFPIWQTVSTKFHGHIIRSLCVCLIPRRGSIM